MSTELRRVKVDYSNFVLLEFMNMLNNSFAFKDEVIEDKIQDLISYLSGKLYPDIDNCFDYIDIVGYSVYEEYEVEKNPRVLDSVPSLLNAIKNGKFSDNTAAPQNVG